MYARKLEIIILEMLSEFRIVYLTGPRQAGKTTLARTIAENIGMEYISFDNQTILESAQNDPIGFINALQDKKIILDEFQYIPELIPAIKEASDNLPPDKKGKFLLTGSADIFRSAKTQEALPGHMARLELYPLSISEIRHTDYNIIDYIYHGDFTAQNHSPLTRQDLAKLIIDGGYPEVQDKSPRAKGLWYKSYVEGRLYKDFDTLYSAKDNYHSKLHALIPYLAGLSGNLIKYSNISNDLQQDDKTIKSYIRTLELMFIIKQVPGYIKNKAKSAAITMPKLYMLDTGLACNLLGIKTENQLLNNSHFGGLLENFVFIELTKQATWSKHEVTFFHFRDKYKNEVDIVIEKDNGQIFGIEIKASATVKNADFNGLKKLAKFSGSNFQYGILFYTGKDILPFSHEGVKLYALPIGLLT